MKLKVDLENKLFDTIKRLEIETDELDTAGVFLYYISDDECFDTWHKTIEDAFLSAQEQYGVKRDKWILQS